MRPLVGDKKDYTKSAQSYETRSVRDEKVAAYSPEKSGNYICVDQSNKKSSYRASTVSANQSLAY